ncbi:MAG: nucleoside-diphosphate kinase [Minisyncoccia bacterium]
MRERLQRMLGERTLVLIKPDAIKRGLVGTILLRFEQTGLKIVACKLVFPSRRQLDGHFPKSENWVRGMGEKTLETYQEYGIDPVEILGTTDSLAIGKKIKEWNYHYLTLGPVMVMVLQGIHVVDTVRKLIGHTLPYKAAPGTIRGDFSINAPDLANVVGSACKNLVHASGNLVEAEQEITNWFEPKEIISWERTDEFLHFMQGEFTTTKEEEAMKYTALEQTIESLKEVDPRNAAEHAYALAALHRRDGNNEEAIRFGREAIALFDKCSMETLEDCTARGVVIEGIAIPDIIHQDVVRDRLQPLVL